MSQLGFRHTVQLKLVDDLPSKAKEDLIEGLKQLPLEISEIQAYSFGFDAGLQVGNSTLSIVADFENEDDYKVYRDHPKHVGLIEAHIKPFLVSRSAVQYSLLPSQNFGR
mmetsp:Transcript_33891/g.80442  ORF Transcript_33891/g.80442 Transcript_33891/m.80442 type:complete len:110 (-) Transcript_33891:151-480(-)